SARIYSRTTVTLGGALVYLDLADHDFYFTPHFGPPRTPVLTYEIGPEPSFVCRIFQSSEKTRPNFVVNERIALKQNDLELTILTSTGGAYPATPSTSYTLALKSERWMDKLKPPTHPGGYLELDFEGFDKDMVQNAKLIIFDYNWFVKLPE